MLALTPGITEQHLAELYADPLIARVGYDGHPARPINHPLLSYLSAWMDGEFVGAYIAIRFNEYELELHSLLLRKATRHSRQFGALLLDWAFSHPSVLRVTGYVTEGLESAVNHCIKMGFTYEGMRRDALLVNGEPRGLHILGMTRKEWSEL